jgi:hypothetical protein
VTGRGVPEDLPVRQDEHVGEQDEQLAQLADQLYALPPGRFVAQRAAAAAAARQAGDKQTAAALGKLRRPTVAAWLVNLLAIERPESVAQLRELAATLRQAQRQLDGAALRELAGQRRRTVAALVAEARSLALAADPTTAGGKLPLAEVEAALHATLTDPEVAEQVRTGRLVRTPTPQGFGELPPPRLRLLPGGAGQPGTDQPDLGPAEATRSDVEQRAASPGAGAAGSATEPESAADQPTGPSRDEIEAELAQARTAATEAAAELARCTSEQKAVKQQLADVEAAIAELTARRTELNGQLAMADAAGLAARRAVVAARRRVGEAEAALAQPPER